MILEARRAIWTSTTFCPISLDRGALVRGLAKTSAAPLAGDLGDLVILGDLAVAWIMTSEILSRSLLRVPCLAGATITAAKAGSLISKSQPESATMRQSASKAKARKHAMAWGICSSKSESRQTQNTA